MPPIGDTLLSGAEQCGDEIIKSRSFGACTSRLLKAPISVSFHTIGFKANAYRLEGVNKANHHDCIISRH